MLITLHMFSLSVVCTLNTQLKLLPFKRCTVLSYKTDGKREFDSNCIIWGRFEHMAPYFDSVTVVCIGH